MCPNGFKILNCDEKEQVYDINRLFSFFKSKILAVFRHLDHENKKIPEENKQKAKKHKIFLNFIILIHSNCTKNFL